MEKFLADQLGGRFEALTTSEIESSTLIPEQKALFISNQTAVN